MYKQVYNQLLTVLATATGINTLAPALPQAVQNFELPMILVLPTGNTLTQQSPPIYNYSASWTVVLYVAQVNQGLRANILDSAYDLADAVYEAFQERPQLLTAGNTKVNGVTMARLTGDGGLGVEPFPAAQDQSMYWSWRFNLVVEYSQIRRGC